MKKITARITENGNGLPQVGEMCYDASTDSAYRIIGWDGSDRISTNPPGCGNSVDVVLEYVGQASDIPEDQWSDIESSNYGVLVSS